MVAKLPKQDRAMLPDLDATARRSSARAQLAQMLYRWNESIDWRLVVGSTKDRERAATGRFAWGARRLIRAPARRCKGSFNDDRAMRQLLVPGWRSEAFDSTWSSFGQGCSRRSPTCPWRRRKRVPFPDIGPCSKPRLR